MHILTKLKIDVGPVLEDAAADHYAHTGQHIKYFILPVLQFEKLKREPGFVLSGFSYIGKWKNFEIIKNKNSLKCQMREAHDTHHYDVYYYKGK